MQKPLSILYHFVDSFCSDRIVLEQETHGMDLNFTANLRQDENVFGGFIGHFHGKYAVLYHPSLAALLHQQPLCVTIELGTKRNEIQMENFFTLHTPHVSDPFLFGFALFPWVLSFRYCLLLRITGHSTNLSKLQTNPTVPLPVIQLLK